MKVYSTADDMTNREQLLDAFVYFSALLVDISVEKTIKHTQVALTITTCSFEAFQQSTSLLKCACS
jgi:hypothetical protein